MQVSAISTHNNQNHPKFTSAFVTLAEKNLGKHIAENVVEAFNKGLLPKLSSSKHLDEFTSIAANADFWALGAGSGSRFKSLAAAFTEKTGIEANKISLPVPIGNGKSIHILDWAMAMGVPFAKADGKIIPVIAKTPSGSFGDIVRFYKENPDKIKDLIVCCGDNVFGTKRGELISFIKEVIENPKLTLGLVGVKRTPQIAAERYGVLKVGNRLANKQDVIILEGFVEKPPLKEALEMAKNGYCIANTGMFVIKKPAMEELMKNLQKTPDLIMKNAEEPYDFANAVKWVHENYGSQKSVVKVIDKWEDVGEPFAFYNFLNNLKHREFLEEFGSAKSEIQKAIVDRFKFNGNKGSLLLSDIYKNIKEVPQSVVDNAKIIDGVSIIA